MISDNISLSHEHLDTSGVIPGVVFRIDARSPNVGINYDGTNIQEYLMRVLQQEELITV